MLPKSRFSGTAAGAGKLRKLWTLALDPSIARVTILASHDACYDRGAPTGIVSEAPHLRISIFDLQATCGTCVLLTR